MNFPESTLDLLVSGLMGIFGGLIATPINALFSWWLKRDEQLLQHKLSMIEKKQELLLQHKLEMERKEKDKELAELKTIVLNWEKRFKNE